MENNVLQNQFDELKADYDYLEEQHNDLQSLTNNIDDLTYKLQQFELNKIKTDKQMSVVNTSITILEKDKNLLVILRYDATRERAEAYDYWQNIKTKSVAVDPSLGPKVDKIISINSNFFSKFIFYFFSKFNLIKTIDIKKLFLEIKNMIYLKNFPKQKNIKGIFLNVPRTQFIDRLLRLILG